MESFNFIFLLEITYDMATKYKKTKKEIAFEERMTKQRAKRGFSDQDVWSIDWWFCETIAPMLRQLAKTSHGCPTLDENGDFTDNDHNSDVNIDVYAKRWEDTLLHMAYLADEMNEMKCSMKNPYDKDWHRICRAFDKKYGDMGEKLMSEEARLEAEKTGRYPCYLPDADPVHGEENRKIMDLHSEYSNKIIEYRDKCKNEFFELFSKYFNHLWD